MKIGIITFHRANNIGAVLQASALQQYINNNCAASGINAAGGTEIIDFIPNNRVVHGNCVRKLLVFAKETIIKCIDCIKQGRNYKFGLFKRKNLALSSETYYGDEGIGKAVNKYDILVSGSDQILNTTLTSNSKSYYLYFDDKARKVSYASSFGRSDISDDELALIRSELPKFEAISVREKSAGEIIEREIGVKTQLVVDPVFLMSASEWKKLANQKMELPKKYIFVYSMEVSDKLEDVVISLTEATNLPVIVVRGGGKTGRIAGEEDPNCGPAEFLRYIKDASYVVTNSFHGTALSLIFGKRYYCIAHSKRNTRLENIMLLTGYRDLLIDKDTKLDIICDIAVDGQKGYRQLEDLIKSSKDYLATTLK